MLLGGPHQFVGQGDATLHFVDKPSVTACCIFCIFLILFVFSCLQLASEDLSKAWIEQSKELMWRVAFQTMGLHVDLPDEVASADSHPGQGSSGVNGPEITTPKKNPRKQKLSDQNNPTPEKEKEKGDKRKAKSIRPVSFGQPKTKESVLTAAGKRPAVDTPEMEPPVNSGKKLKCHERKKGKPELDETEVDPLEILDKGDKDSGFKMFPTMCTSHD